MIADHKSRHAAAVALLLGAISGCGEAIDGPPIYPVEGKVLVDGKPAEKAEVIFHPLSGDTKGSPPPTAQVEADGTFRPSTRLAHDGAPAGEYGISIVWRKITVVEGEEIAGADILKGRFSDPKRSGLTATIKEGDNILEPFELKAGR